MSSAVSRRLFLTGGLAAALVLQARPSFAAEAAGKGSSADPLTLDEIVAMSPEQMARRSSCVMDSWQYLLDACDEIGDATVRRSVRALLNNPAPRLAEGNVAARAARLRKMGLLDHEELLPPCLETARSPQPFLTAPGSGWKSHHCYPGGLVTHTAFNVASCKALYDNYATRFDLKLDRDVLLASQILHDIHKPWVFQWQADGTCRTELTLAGTGEHHILSIAESLRSGLAPEIVVAQACAHDHPGTPASEAGVANWLRAAAVLCDRDPVKAGLLSGDGKTLPRPCRMEGFVTHLADHDFVLSSPACQWTVQALRPIARKFGVTEADLDKKPFNQFRNYVLSQKSAMYLYEVSVRGEDALLAEVQKLVRK